MRIIEFITEIITVKRYAESIEICDLQQCLQFQRILCYHPDEMQCPLLTRNSRSAGTPQILVPGAGQLDPLSTTQLQTTKLCVPKDDIGGVPADREFSVNSGHCVSAVLTSGQRNQNKQIATFTVLIGIFSSNWEFFRSIGNFFSRLGKILVPETGPSFVKRKSPVQYRYL